MPPNSATRSEEHTSELQSPCNLVCRLLLEKILPSREMIWALISPTFSLRRMSTGSSPFTILVRSSGTHLGQSESVVRVLFFNDTATTEIYTLSLHDALPICFRHGIGDRLGYRQRHCHRDRHQPRSEEHTSELQSPCNLVCRLLLEKKAI